MYSGSVKKNPDIKVIHATETIIYQTTEIPNFIAMRLRYLIFLFFAATLVSCENQAFDRDKRQIEAKDAIHRKLPPRALSFDITAFKEDTLAFWPDTLFKRPIRYLLDVVYKDSTGTVQAKKAIVIFTPDGRSIMTSEIIDR